MSWLRAVRIRLAKASMGLRNVERTWPSLGWRVSLSRPAARDAGVAHAPRVYADAADAALAAWAADGDRRAFEEIVLRHGAFALRVATRMLRNTATAEDVVQEAFVRAWSQVGRYDGARGRFSTWLYRIVANLCIDQRRRTRTESLPEDFDPVDPAADIPQRLEDDERQADLAKALAALPDRQRAAMTLVYDEGLSGAETAKALGVSVKAVERLLARGRAFLRERLRS